MGADAPGTLDSKGKAPLRVAQGSQSGGVAQGLSGGTATEDLTGKGKTPRRVTLGLLGVQWYSKWTRFGVEPPCDS
eukprot:3193610-Rhodomonas_salina.1